MNKKTIITILLALVATAGQGQIHYRLEGNIGDSTIPLGSLPLRQGTCYCEPLDAFSTSPGASCL